MQCDQNTIEGQLSSEQLGASEEQAVDQIARVLVFIARELYQKEVEIGKEIVSSLLQENGSKL